MAYKRGKSRMLRLQGSLRRVDMERQNPVMVRLPNMAMPLMGLRFLKSLQFPVLHSLKP
jgi:hypothetical protein